LWNDPKASVVRAAREVNASMPSRALELIESKVGSVEGLNVAILGIAYRPKVKETAFSGSLNLLELLNTVGANVYGLDPLYSSVELASLGFKEIKNLKEMDVIILHTAHEEFREIDFSSFSRIKIILDGRNFYGINDFPGELQIIKI
jgi:UDP-N-acetyl-D-mannosaminuronate dehydrogenase